VGWASRNTVSGAGVKITHRQDHPYPEVSGYYIPTFLKWGGKDLALQYARWLVSIQNEDGSWSDALGKAPYTFDTGQILKGLLSLVEVYPEFKGPILSGCDWLLTQVQESGRVVTPDLSHWRLPDGRLVPEAIHLYALEPLREAGRRWGVARSSAAVDRALQFYLGQPGLTAFNTLSHFHAYIIEALIDLGCAEQAARAMREVAGFQKRDGSIPGYREVDWVCSTGLFQYAVIWYKLGDLARADRAFDAACRLQNRTGGFYGGYGQGANYFPDEEISWAVKYFLDAFWLKVKTSFKPDLSAFPDDIEETDGRYRLVAEVAARQLPKRILDAGCGKGRIAKRLKAADPAREVVGMDLSEEMLSRLPPELTPVSGSVLNMPFPDGSFDLVFCVEALEHAIDVPAAIHELSRVTGTNGTLVIIDKDQKKLGVMKISEWEQWFSERDITRMLEREGLTVEVRRNIPYHSQDGSDGLFLGWVARK
jgi:malonyl-CoA O-methyltransferase